MSSDGTLHVFVLSMGLNVFITEVSALAALGASEALLRISRIIEDRDNVTESFYVCLTLR